MASSLPNSETSRDMTPLHTLHDAQEPVRLGDSGAMVPQKMPRTRKVAAGPPIPTYKGGHFQFQSTKHLPRYNQLG